MKVYKYFPLNEEKRITRLLKMIEDSKVWFSVYNQLNDPMEGIYYTFEFSKKVLEAFKTEKQKQLIGCFGRSPKSTTLWRYYAAGYNGCCVEFDVADKIGNLYKKSNVEYVNWDMFEKPIDPNEDALFSILFRKLKAWNTENEYRIVVKKEGNDNYVKIGNTTAVYLGSGVKKSTVSKIKITTDQKRIPLYKVYPDRKKEFESLNPQIF